MLALQVDLFRAEVWRPSLLRLVAFISFFPQLVAGPIVRGRELLPQLDRRAEWVPEGFIDGLTRFAWGLLKKRVVADSMAPSVAWLFDEGHHADGFLVAACGVSAYAVQIYFDFSAYSDMAVGLGRMFGLEIPENFRQPYGSRTVTEFWRRWHVTLSSWLRDYLYIPLGGNRRGAFRQQLNLVVTMLLGGLWHGANWTFVVWGAWHGAWLLIEARTGLRRMESRASGHSVAAAIATTRTMAVVLTGWILFRASDLATAAGVLWSLSGVRGWGQLGAIPGEALVAPLALLATMVKHRLGVASPYTLLSRSGEYAYGRGLAFALAVVVLLVFAAPTSTFIYWQF
jgi:alginate O-acetyltransferase complex protein AlgI